MLTKLRNALRLLAIGLALCLCQATAKAEQRGFMLCTLPITDYRLYESDPRFDLLRADIDRTHKLGATIFRLPIYLPDAPDLTYWLALAHEAEYQCWLRGCTLVIDLHRPGFDVFAEPDRFASIWGVIADSFKNNGARVHYDLLNEPSTPMWGLTTDHPTPINIRWNQWYGLANYAASTIALFDRNPEHKIVFCCLGVNFEESSLWQPLTAVPQNRQWATAHGWVWNDAALSPTGKYPTETRTYLRLSTQINAFKNIERRYPQVRCFVGELGFHRSAPGCKAFMEDATGLCRALNIHVCIHALNEAEQWDYDAVAPGPATASPAWRPIKSWLAAP